MYRPALSAIALVALGVAACGDTGRTTTAEQTQRDDAEITTAAQDRQDEQIGTQTGEDQPVVERVQDAVADPVGVANAAIRGGDTEAYVRNLTLAHRYESEAGAIASERAGNAGVRRAARRMLEEHDRMQAAFEAALVVSGVQVEIPNELDERRQGMIDNLRAAPAADFDNVFLRQQETTHREILTWHEAYESRGDNEQLRAAATEARLQAEAHLEMIRQVQETTGDGR